MIILISDTPVAGTVNRIAHWLNQLSGIRCHALIRCNYPHNAFRLDGGAFSVLPEWEKFIVQCVRKARVIFFHNIVDDKLSDIVFNTKPFNTKVYYQIHSPPLEPPLFDYQVISDYPFDAILAIAQGHGRFIQDSIIVPNIIADFTPPCQIKKNPLIFNPSMRSTTFRWSAKFTESDKKYLLANQDKIGNYRISKDVHQLFGREIVTHEEILLYLQAVSIVIDDINTGLFHQTALEAIKAGCAVFSAADLESIEEFCIAVDVDAPPFLYVYGIEDVVSMLADRSFRKALPTVMDKSKEYAQLYLSEKRLAQCYWSQVKLLVE